MNETMEQDKRPVMVVIDSDGFIHRAGDPSVADKNETMRYLQEGYIVKTIFFYEYKKLVWIWDKPLPSPPINK